jgi:hypothetical protein
MNEWTDASLVSVTEGTALITVAGSAVSIKLLTCKGANNQAKHCMHSGVILHASSFVTITQASNL